MKRVYFETRSSFALVRVSGEDRFSFLQGQFTADLRPLAEGQGASVYGLFLDNRGKMVTDAFIQASKEEFVVYAPSVEPEVLIERLDSYLIADEVELEDMSGDYSIVTLSGEAETPGDDEGIYRFPSRRWPAPAFDYLLADEKKKAFLDGFGDKEMTEAEPGTVAENRVLHNLPRVPQDTGPRLLPQEAGFENCVCYTKGCFLGQEVMARFKNFGARRRGLFPVRIDGENLPEPPFSLALNEKKGGEMISLIRMPEGSGLGFAMLPLEWEHSNGGWSTTTGAINAVEILKSSPGYHERK
ncbi:MAG: hypothetical protein LAT55_07885 [Opitutales bacterium]|nr:hypothetical protein [Opitutales bacterium]